MSTKQEVLRMNEAAQAPVQVEEPTNLLAVVADAARDPQCDVNKMRALLEMKRELERDEAKRQFDLAMNAVQKAIEPIAADAANPQTHSKYASYHALDRAIRPFYTAHGFSVAFDTEDCPLPAHKRVVCIVSRGGHERRYRDDVPIDTKGPKGNDVMTKTHAGGSALQYGKRYTLAMAFNIAVAKDDDGNGASAMLITEDEAKTFHKLCDDLEADEAKICEHVGAEKVEDMTAAQLKKATTAVNAWARAQRSKAKEHA